MPCLWVTVAIACFLELAASETSMPLHGRYTRDVERYELLVPRKLTEEGRFLTYSLPHYYTHDGKLARAKRDVPVGDSVHYGISLGGVDHLVELWPNHGLIAPDSVVERRTARIKDAKLEKLTSKRQCHYTGKVRGIEDSNAAISTCDGLAGYVRIRNRRFFLEPLLEHVANKRGQHLHVAYEANDKLRKKYKGPQCGTEEKWEDAWRDRLRRSFGEDPSDGTSKRAMESVHRYLETLVVADKSFLQYHKNSDYQQYIMTIMNMVADYYNDASSGNQMDIVVVRMMFLEKEEEEIDLAISPDGDKTLDSFCKWQQTVNPKDIRNPNHHDIAVLLTRYDICADNMTSCGLMGLAFVATACTADKPCAINEDAGLVLGIVVAHEIGHVMGCSHDKEEESGCRPQAEDQSYHVMSPYVHLHTNVWSTCSKTFMTTFFDNDLGECLNDEPESSLYQYTNMLPGVLYDAKYQCQTEFPGSSVCKVKPERFCQKLLCRTSPTECMSNGEPPADGTMCGENKWCYNAKCVEMGERPEAVNGGWGEWGSFSKCSRSCGAGVSISERECMNPTPQHKGRYCMGDRKKIKICNTQPCPDGAPSFRAVQCTEYNSKPFMEELFTWRPYVKEDDPCSLYCINNANTYVKLAPRAKDGTRCKPGTKNMCVSGVCRVLGCDYGLDSDALEDVCGVCKGDSTECKIVERTFQAPPGQGYVKVAVIFRGCRNVVVEELKPSGNTIAVTGPDEKRYYLNGDFTEMPDGVRDFGGTEGIYTHPEPDKEHLIIHGPLKENLVLFVVFYESDNVGYRYKYAEPTSKNNYQPVYHWEFVDWDACSARCGGGVEKSEPKCIEEKNGLVSSSFCQATDKPPIKTRKCNEQPCRTKWRVGKWGKCFACKNIPGLKLREVECVRESSIAGEDDILVEDSECKEIRPGTKELCKSQKPCIHKRHTNGLPDSEMRNVWLQTSGIGGIADTNNLASSQDIRNRHKIVRAIRVKKNELECEPPDQKSTKHWPGDKTGHKDSKPKPTLKVGTIVDDRITPEEIKLIQVPVKQSHNALNITDSAMDSMGDSISDVIDFEHQVLHKGDEAAKMLKDIQHSNGTIVETN